MSCPLCGNSRCLLSHLFAFQNLFIVPNRLLWRKLLISINPGFTRPNHFFSLKHHSIHRIRKLHTALVSPLITTSPKYLYTLQLFAKEKHLLHHIFAFFYFSHFPNFIHLSHSAHYLCQCSNFEKHFILNAQSVATAKADWEFQYLHKVSNWIKSHSAATTDVNLRPVLCVRSCSWTSESGVDWFNGFVQTTEYIKLYSYI